MIIKNNRDIDSLKYRIQYLEDSINNNSLVPKQIKMILDNPKFNGIHNVIASLIDTDNKYNTEYRPGSILSECKYCCPASQYSHYICHRQKCCPQYRPPFFPGYQYCEEGSPATACSQILW